jgi:hypothetical protein
MMDAYQTGRNVGTADQDVLMGDDLRLFVDGMKVLECCSWYEGIVEGW